MAYDEQLAQLVRSILNEVPIEPAAPCPRIWDDRSTDDGLDFGGACGDHA
jgi:hypothetical protein